MLLLICVGIGSAVGCVPSDPLPSSLGIRERGIEVEVFVPTCPGERILTVQMYEDLPNVDIDQDVPILWEAEGYAADSGGSGHLLVLGDSSDWGEESVELSQIPDAFEVVVDTSERRFVGLVESRNELTALNSEDPRKFVSTYAEEGQTQTELLRTAEC